MYANGKNGIAKAGALGQGLGCFYAAFFKGDFTIFLITGKYTGEPYAIRKKSDHRSREAIKKEERVGSIDLNK